MTSEFLQPQTIDVLLRGKSCLTLVNTILPSCYLFIIYLTLLRPFSRWLWHLRCLLNDSAESEKTTESGP